MGTEIIVLFAILTVFGGASARVVSSVLRYRKEKREVDSLFY